MSSCTQIPANPDVTGIGIRINLYITGLVLAAIPTEPTVSWRPSQVGSKTRQKSNSQKLREVTSGAAAVSGLSLLITAIIQTVNGHLSLYHAIFVIHALYFMGVIVVPGGEYETSNAVARVIRLLLTLLMISGSMVAFIIFGLYLWANASTFGSIPECNGQIKYVFFWHSVSPTEEWLRGLWITALAILAILITLVIAAGFSMANSEQLSGWKKKLEHAKSKYWHIIRLWRLLVVIYGVIMLELYLRRNRDLVGYDDQVWTFGQVMALVQIFGVANELFHSLICSAPRMIAKIKEEFRRQPSEPK